MEAEQTHGGPTICLLPLVVCSQNRRMAQHLGCHPSAQEDSRLALGVSYSTRVVSARWHLLSPPQITRARGKRSSGLNVLESL